MTPIVFLHHQRTGGTTVREAYRHKLLTLPYRVRDDVPNRIITSLKKKPEVYIFEVEPGVYMPELENIVQYCTIMREPIERIISLVEIQSRPGDATNIFRAQSYEFRTKEEFWEGVKIHIDTRTNTAQYLPNYHDMIVRSLCGKHLVPMTEADLDMATERILNIPFMVYNKSTFPTDLLEFTKSVGMGDPDYPVEHYMKGSDDFKDSVPDWMYEFLDKINVFDRELYARVLKAKA